MDWIRTKRGAAVVATVAAALLLGACDEFSVARRFAGSAKKLPYVTPGKKAPKTFNFPSFFVDAQYSIHTDNTFEIDPTLTIYPTVSGTFVPGKHGKGAFKATDDPTVGPFMAALLKAIVKTNIDVTSTKTSFSGSVKKGQPILSGSVIVTGTVSSGPDAGRAFKSTFKFSGKTAPPN